MIKREGRWRRIHYKGPLIKFQEFSTTEKKCVSSSFVPPILIEIDGHMVRFLQI